VLALCGLPAGCSLNYTCMYLGLAFGFLRDARNICIGSVGLMLDMCWYAVGDMLDVLRVSVGLTWDADDDSFMCCVSCWFYVGLPLDNVGIMIAVVLGLVV